MRVAFLGLGNMGTPMALNLLQAGHEITVFNRTAGKTQTLAEKGATVASTPAEAVARCEVMVTMLADDDAARDVLQLAEFGQDAAIETLPKGAIHMSCSTISVEFSRKLAAEHGKRGQDYMAAAVVGRPDAAAGKKLWVVAAGPSNVIERCRPLVDGIGRGMTIVGNQPWQANLVKIATNFMLASCLEAFGESFALIRKSGMEPHQFMEVVNSTFNSPVYANYGRIIADRQFEPAGFRLKWGLKDIRLALEAAEDFLVPLPLASLIRDHYLTAIARGRENQDWSAITEVAAEEGAVQNDAA